MDLSMSAPSRPSVWRTLAPNLAWEAVLLLAVIAVGVAANIAHPGLVWRSVLWPPLASLGLLATGLALSLRTGTPNLAVSMIASLSGWLYAERLVDGSSAVSAGLVGVLGATAVGLVFALVVGLTTMPAWLVTLVGGFLVQGLLLVGTDGVGMPVPGRGPAPNDFRVWVMLFGVVSVAGGVAFAVPAVRAALGANRPSADDPEVPGRFRLTKLLGALVGLVGSSLLAGLSGVVLTTYTRFVVPQDNGQLPLVLAAVLLGGVSVFGRRGGVLGVLLGVLLIQLVRQWEILGASKYAIVLITVGVLALVGVVVNWLLELAGRALERPRAVPALPPPSWSVNGAQAGWSVPPTSGVPAPEQPER